MPTNCPPVQLKPIATERMWGGHNMKSWFGLPDDGRPIGEYWLVSAHPSQQSVVTGGAFDGWSLAALVERYPDDYLGTSPQARFPLLIKLIEAKADLSVQVHPDDAYAKAHAADYGKTEAWYILDVPETGRVVYGHHFRNRTEYLQAVTEGRVMEYLDYRRIRSGEMVYVPAGTLHALLGGTTLIEVQQTSDVTYRVYDWGRVDASGQSRALHVESAADVLRYDEPHDAGPVVDQNTVIGEGHGEVLLLCPYFRVERWSGHGEGVVTLPESRNPSVVIGVSGTGRLMWQGSELGRVRTGDAWLLPSACSTAALVGGVEPWVVLCITY